jgi:hypothetical protein
MMKTWCSNLACHYLSRASPQCSVVTVTAQAKKHARTTYLESQKAAGIFFFNDYVALIFLAGGDDACLHIMDTLLILLVARLNLVSSCIKMH